jgi:hypothetical protein
MHTKSDERLSALRCAGCDRGVPFGWRSITCDGNVADA